MKAIAMKATQQDWDSVKDLVENHKKIWSFESYPYLVTNCNSEIGVVTNLSRIDILSYGRKVYETFDRAIFLDALDIVEDKVWKGSDMQFRDKGNYDWFDCSKFCEFRLKPINPEVKQLQELADKLGYKIDKL